MHVSVVGPSVRASTVPDPDATVSFGISFELGSVFPQLPGEPSLTRYSYISWAFDDFAGSKRARTENSSQSARYSAGLARRGGPRPTSRAGPTRQLAAGRRRSTLLSPLEGQATVVWTRTGDLIASAGVPQGVETMVPTAEGGVWAAIPSTGELVRLRFAPG